MKETETATANNSSTFIERVRPDVGVSEPAYKQLLRRIIDMIESGEIAHGYSLPFERALAQALTSVVPLYGAVTKNCAPRIMSTCMDVRESKSKRRQELTRNWVNSKALSR